MSDHKRVTRHRDGTVSIRVTKGQADEIYFSLIAGARHLDAILAGLHPDDKIRRAELKLAHDNRVRLAHEILDGTWPT